MATERVTTRNDGLMTERIIERDGDGTTFVDRGGSGVAGVIIGIALLALVAFAAIFMLEARRNDAIRTNAVSSAAASLANSTAEAVRRANDPANDAAGTIEPPK
jgi:predicted lipid-binding transport protein (Tim44 family)